MAFTGASTATLTVAAGTIFQGVLVYLAPPPPTGAPEIASSASSDRPMGDFSGARSAVEPTSHWLRGHEGSVHR
eukprot:195410-Pyramimonas_sp.AAC.1